MAQSMRKSRFNQVGEGGIEIAGELQKTTWTNWITATLRLHLHSSGLILKNCLVQYGSRVNNTTAIFFAEQTDGRGTDQTIEDNGESD